MYSVPYLMQGINLVESGRKQEALPYLRYAARHEPINAEGWLWLAAASDDREEYRHCINMALQLDPQHPVAARMRADLERQDWQLAGGFPIGPVNTPPVASTPIIGMVSPPTAYPLADTGTWQRPSRLRRALRALVIALLLGGCLGGIASLVVSGVLIDLGRDVLRIEETHSLQFTVGELPGFRFRVEVPETWMPADSDSGTWRSTRDNLLAAFSVPDDQISVWELVEESFSTAVRDPVYGQVIPNVRLVETDVDLLGRHNMVTALTLHEIVPFPTPPEGATGDVCGRVRAVEAAFRADGALATQPDSALVASDVIERADLGDCAFFVHRRYTNQPAHEVSFPVTIDRAPTVTREITLVVPVGEARYAVWVLTLADSAYDDYDSAIDRVIKTLVHRPT